MLSIALIVGAFFLFKDRFQEMALFGKETDKSKKNFEISEFDERAKEKSSPESEIEKENERYLKQAMSNLVLAQAAAREFLHCNTFEEYAAVIRDPERVMPHVRKFYQDNPYQLTGRYSISKDGATEVAKNFLSFQVVLGNYSKQQIAVELTDDGAKVDWESWVSYCEQPWDSFVEERTSEPTLVRVAITADSYYNFSFRDDSKWVCYRLSRSPDEPVIFGYLPSDSPLRKKLPKTQNIPEAVILKIRYPDDAVSGDQVLITDFVASGWVLGL